MTSDQRTTVPGASPHTRRTLPLAGRGALGALLALFAFAAAVLPARAQSEGSSRPSVSSPAGTATGRVMVLGFDGADWRTTEAMMDAGELPNLARLRAEGTAQPLISTDPAESAAGWAAINTGANPARNGVASFVKRKIAGESVLPTFAHVEPKIKEVDAAEVEAQSSALSRILLETNPLLLAGVVALVALLVFRFVLRAHFVLALVLGVLLGGGAYFAGNAAEPSVPSRIPTYVSNLVRLDGFWVEAARAGHPSIALQAPMAFDRPGADGARTLYGLGVPDVLGSINGDWAIYTTRIMATGRPPKGEDIGSTGKRFRVDFETPKDGGPERIADFIYGPIDFVAADALTLRFREIEAIINDKDKYAALGFKGSSELSAERREIVKELASMGMPVGNEGGQAKLYRHRVKVPLTVLRNGDAFDVQIGGETKTVPTGEWSDFYTVRFQLGSSFELSAITRVRVLGDDPFELYVDTLQYDPRDQAFWQPVTSPPSFGRDLAQRLGAPFETLGWGCMTNQLKDRAIEPEVFLEDVEFTMRWRRKLFEEALGDGSWKVLYSVFSTTDRVQHMMYRYYDPEHPMYDAEKAASTVTFFGEEVALKDTIPAIYRQMDAIVGVALEALTPDDTLILCADHGFTSYRRGMNVNNWLAEEGFLVLRDGLTSAGEGTMLGAIDWSRTQAYSLGLGMVYLNLEGREPNGIVSPADAGAVMERICERFLASRDDGRTVGSSATIVRDLYVGPEEWGSADYPCADVMLGFAENYRTSWSTVDGSLPLVRGEGGFTPAPVYLDNDSLWSGDHASNDPRLVSGIFFCNRKLEVPEDGFSVLHIAPTVLDRLGVPPLEQFDLGPLRDAK